MKKMQVDIGNTQSKFRIMNAKVRVAGGTCSIFDLADIAQKNEVGKIVLASVQEAEVQSRLSREIAEAGINDVRWLKTAPRFGQVINAYSDYKCLGVDRWLAVVSAYYKYQHKSQRSCCVFDFGSAVTVDFVNSEGHHKGGYIIPGSGLCFAALGQNTAALKPEIVLTTSDNVGTDTESCIQNGIYILQTAFVRRILNNLNNDDYIVCTGGGFSQVEKEFKGKDYIFDQELILDGIDMVSTLSVD